MENPQVGNTGLWLLSRGNCHTDLRLYKREEYLNFKCWPALLRVLAFPAQSYEVVSEHPFHPRVWKIFPLYFTHSLLSVCRFVAHSETTAVCVVRSGSAFAFLLWGRPFSQHFPMNNPPSCHLWWSYCCHVLSSIWAMSSPESLSAPWVSWVLFVNSPVFQSVLLSAEEISFFVTFSNCLLPMQRNVPFSKF